MFVFSNKKIVFKVFSIYICTEQLKIENMFLEILRDFSEGATITHDADVVFRHIIADLADNVNQGYDIDDYELKNNHGSENLHFFADKDYCNGNFNQYSSLSIEIDSDNEEYFDFSQKYVDLLNRLIEELYNESKRKSQEDADYKMSLNRMFI